MYRKILIKSAPNTKELQQSGRTVYEINILIQAYHCYYLATRFNFILIVSEDIDLFFLEIVFRVRF